MVKDKGQRRKPGAGSWKPEAGSPEPLAAALCRYERSNGRDPLGIQHVAGLEPAAARGADAELQLAAHEVGAVAVAVHHQRGAAADRPSGQRPVEIEVPG